MDDEQMDGWMNKRMDHEWIDGQQKKKSKKERKGRKKEGIFLWKWKTLKTTG